VYESNLRLNIKATGLRTYPDASVYCGAVVRDEEDASGETAINPIVLFEVLSKTTEAYDRGEKALNYRQIESLRAYILVSQREASVEMFERQSDGPWVLREAHGKEAVLTIAAISVNLPLADIYDRIDFSDAQQAEEPSISTVDRFSR